ncbi:hypothetical protein T05_7684 [Trichinella murrelli]|uniref:Uncharacterized protein n=1 Tax=Trichinella murrelli TaxID=144512 RepID=A0A0V0T9P3_9BILA|nr:hypothetical protein T05_7684 [Trichinella murrelli]
MPKVKSKPSKKLIDLVNEYGSDISSTDNTVLFCKACGKSINHEKNSKSQFPTELCMAFIDAGIPLWKLENKSLRSFLEKYTKQHIPSESSLRKHYIDNNFNNVMDRVRREVAYNKIWISIDETIDPVGRFVANVVIVQQLLSCLHLHLLAVLWPEGIRYENVLLFVTDAAPYMKKAAGALKVLFPNMLHLTCLAHGLHRIAEHIRCLFPDVDRLISNMKKVFLKAPSRVQLFKEMAPEIPLPPQPVLTRWGTWLSAVFYYAANFKKIQEIRQVGRLGLRTDYMNNQEVRKKVKMLMALAFLPVHLAPAGFEIINVGMSGQLEALYQYFQQEWLPATKIPLWNVHGVSVRTNNHLEGWHSRMNKRARKHHLGFYQFLYLILDEQGKTETVVRQINDGYTHGRGSVRRSAAYGVQQRRVAALTGKLVHNEISVEHFLSAISYHTPEPLRL